MRFSAPAANSQAPFWRRVRLGGPNPPGRNLERQHYVCPADAIQSAAQHLFGQLAKEQLLRGLDAAEFSKRAGHYLGEINVLHPFREGNGRTQREFIGQLAQQAGHRIDWSGVSQASMTQASIEAYNGDSSGLAGLIRAGMPDQLFFNP